MKSGTTKTNLFVMSFFATAVLSIFAFAITVNAAVPNWNIAGTWNLDFNLGGGHYLHTMTVTSFDPTTGVFSGTGVYTPDLSYTWMVTGTVSGNDITFHIVYTGTGAGYTVDATGTITSATSMSGTWISSASQSGTWIGTGTATAIAKCPAGTTQVYKETINVNSASSTATLSSALSSGKNYLLVSSGTWENIGKNVADTEYASIDNWATHMDGYDISPYFLGVGEFDLQVDGAFVNWGGYNSVHTYSHLYTGTGNPVSFLVFDGDSNAPTPVPIPGWYGDNSGSLTVKIYSCNPINQLTALSPAKMWIGLKNSDDVGTKFDLKAEVFDGSTLVGYGEIDGVSGGSSGFNNAVNRSIDLNLTGSPVASGDTLSYTLSVRISTVAGHRSGTARLWYNDVQADSHFDATIGGVTNDYYLLNSFALGTSPGTSPKKTIDVFVDKLVGGNAFKPFGTWSITL